MVTASFAFQPRHSVCAEALGFAGFLWFAGLLGSVCLRSSSMACTFETRTNASPETNKFLLLPRSLLCMNYETRYVV